MEPVITERKDQVLKVTINRPDRRNAINDAVVAGIGIALQEAERDRSVRVVILTGVGDQAFCSGADMSGRAKQVEDYALGSLPFAKLLKQARDMSVPLIGRINGHCMAGGMGLLAMCDLAVTVDTARFGLPEVRLGLFPMQVYSLLRSIVPVRKLCELAMTGEPMTAAEAKESGLVNYVVAADELDARVDGLAASIAAKSPTAVRLGKRAMRHVESMTFDESLAFLEAQISILAHTGDAIEGRRAFMEKRPPIWSE